MSIFSERLSELMFESGYNNKMLAQQLGINAASITLYLQEKHNPTVDILVKIADLFQRSTDFLLGREEDNNNLKFKQRSPFCRQLAFLKEHYGCSAYNIYNNTDISKSGYYEWLSGKRQPTVYNIIKLADHFGCRIDFVLGREA